MDSVKHAPSGVDSESNRNDQHWSDAVRDAEEFSDQFLDDSFIEIERRLLSLKHRKKPALVQALTQGQIISLKHLLPEMELAGFENTAAAAKADSDYSAPAAHSGDTLNQTWPTWIAELTTLDYDDLYADMESELENEALTDTEETVSRMLKSLNTRDLSSTSEQHIEGASQQTEMEAPVLEDLPVPEVRFTELELEPVNSEPAEEEPELLYAPDHATQYTFTTPDHIHDETVSKVSQNTEELNGEVDIENVAQVSRIEPEPAANALQLSSDIPHIDPQKIAQALVDMYMENERVLAEQREAQRAAQATQRRQLVLISAGAVCAVLIAATIVYLLLSANMQALRVPEVSTPAVSSEPPPRYQSVNEALSGTVVGIEPGKAQSEQSTLANADPLDAGSVGAQEFTYYDESLYEPDTLADAENPYYPAAEAEFGISFDQRKADVSPHELAYSQWTNGDLSGARAAYERILNKNPDDTEALVGLGSMAQQQGNNDLAVRYLVRAVKNKPDHAYALAALASLSSTENRAQLESDLMQLARSNPEVAELPFILGNWYARDKRWADAQQAYFDAFNRNSNNADYAFNLAVSLDQLGKSSSARNFYLKAIALAPGIVSHFNVEHARTRAEQLN